MMYLGDYVAGETVYFAWNSNGANGASITRAGNGTISVYKDNNTTQTTTGVTDTEDFDSLTGVHHVAIATSDSFYTTATDFFVVLSGATIDGQTVNAVLAHFSIENRSGLRPTTAGRTLDVSSGGNAGVDFDNIAMTGNGPFAPFGIIDIGTAQAADASSITLRAGFSTNAANMVGTTVWVYSSTNGLHARGLSTAYNNTTKVLTVSGLGEVPTGIVLYVVFATAPGSASDIGTEIAAAVLAAAAADPIDANIQQINTVPIG